MDQGLNLSAVELLLVGQKLREEKESRDYF